MRAIKQYLVPDYYPLFQCKMGACRHACCDGWPVTISMSDYFRLAGVSCSPELRQRLDTALAILPRPDYGAYAQISPRYDGRCKLRLEDGRCALHAELGEEALATVCRLYPRGVRNGENLECSCANSCEAVPELFLKHPEPIRFIYLPLAFNLPEPKKAENIFADGGRGQEIRLYYIRSLQNRSLPLPNRLMTLGWAMQEVEKAVRAGNDEQLCSLLSRDPEPFGRADENPSQEHLNAGLQAVKAILEQVDARSSSVRSFGEEVLEWFAQGENSIEHYRLAVDNFAAILPEWETVFEHLMVNHMFFEQFPYQDRPVPVADEFPAVCTVYTLLRFLSVGWTAIHPAREEFVDVCCALFRLIDHTAFDSYAAGLIKRLGLNTPEQVHNLIRL